MAFEARGQPEPAEELPEKMKITAEVPGLKKEDIKVSVIDNMWSPYPIEGGNDNCCRRC